MSIWLRSLACEEVSCVHGRAGDGRTTVSRTTTYASSSGHQTSIFLTEYTVRLEASFVALKAQKSDNLEEARAAISIHRAKLIKVTERPVPVEPPLYSDSK